MKICSDYFPLSSLKDYNLFSPQLSSNFFLSLYCLKNYGLYDLKNKTKTKSNSPMKVKPVFFIFVPNFKILTFHGQLLDLCVALVLLSTCTDRSYACFYTFTEPVFSTFLMRRTGAEHCSYCFYWVSVAETLLYFLFSFLFISVLLTLYI